MAYTYATKCEEDCFLYEEDLGGGLFRGFSIENNEVTSVILYEESNPRVPHALREISASGTSRYFINIKDSYGKFWMHGRPLEFFSKEVQEGLNKPVNLEELPPEMIEED